MKINFEILLAAILVLLFAISTAAQAETAGQYFDDATITTKVKAALLSDNQLKETTVSVVTDQGAVQLTGAVDNRAQETEAVRVANEVDGVKLVKDMMTVRNSQDN